MEEVQQYSDDGLLEEYCLGLLPVAQAEAITKAAAANTVLQQKILETEKALALLDMAAPPAGLKQTVLQKLQMQAGEQQLIHYSSSAAAWNERVKHLEPTAVFENIKTNFITDTETLQVCVAWLSGTLHETGHDNTDFQESFLILEGSCRCNIGGKIFDLQAGDYLDIPFNTEHTITATSPHTGYVKVIIQRRKTAA